MEYDETKKCECGAIARFVGNVRSDHYYKCPECNNLFCGESIKVVNNG